MSESNAWASQWFKAQQQFVDAWSDMARTGSSGQKSQADLWAQGLDLWRQAGSGQNQPDIQQTIDKCVDMSKDYFAMAEQISKSLSAGAKPVDAINQWMEQLKQSLQQFGTMPGFGGDGVNDFMKQWFAPAESWQQMASGLAPMQQSAWQLPGMNTSVFNMGEAIDPLGKALSAPGIGYFREPQEKQQKGIQLAIEYQKANQAFNQAFLKVALEAVQDFQTRLLKMEDVPRTLRGLYDRWVEISEEHYAEFAMSDEYQSLYGDMVNRLMILKKHYAQITDDMLRAMNLPNTTEVDTMQQRLQQLRRDNIVLKNEVAEIKAMLAQSKPATAAPKSAPAEKPATRGNDKAAGSETRKAPPKKAVKKKSAAKSASKKAPAKKTAANKKPAVTKTSKGA